VTNQAPTLACAALMLFQQVTGVLANAYNVFFGNPADQSVMILAYDFTTFLQKGLNQRQKNF